MRQDIRMVEFQGRKYLDLEDLALAFALAGEQTIAARLAQFRTATWNWRKKRWERPTRVDNHNP